METIKITRTFFEDHIMRDLPAPPVEKKTKSHIWIDATSEHLSELLADADYYADPFTYSDAEFGSSLMGLVKSAKATKRAIENYLNKAAKAAQESTTLLDKTKVQFHSVNQNTFEIWYNSKPTGFMTRQDKEKTKVWGTKHAVIQTDDLALPHTRYSLSSDEPACGHGVSKFISDFLQAWERLGAA